MSVSQLTDDQSCERQEMDLRALIACGAYGCCIATRADSRGLLWVLAVSKRWGVKNT
jgi:hypothetical protein